MTLLNRLTETFYQEKDRWPLWIPVMMGFGIGWYFSLETEPNPWIGRVTFALCLPLYILTRRQVWHWVTVATLALSFGFFMAQVRTDSVDPHMLQRNLPPMGIEAQVEHVEHLTNQDTPSIRLILKDIEPLNSLIDPDVIIPKAVRITVRTPSPDLHPGNRIQLRVKLMPVNEQITPGSFDFRRHAYFQGIGASGFALSSPVIIPEEGTSQSWRQWLNGVRQNITAHLQASMPAPLGDIAAAVITGEKAGIPRDLHQSFADSGLAHILVIAGLHLSIVSAFVFFLIRSGLGMIPAISSRFDVKKLAAFFALILVFIYLQLSGSTIPSTRAFFMTSLVMVAIMLDRKPFSMRLLAFAAFVILTLMPEVLLGPSFQMSFAAVSALIAAYEGLAISLTRWAAVGPPWMRKTTSHLAGMCLTTLITTFATAPYIIFTFNRFSLQGICANLLAVPLTATIVMPVAVLVCFLMPFGADGILMPLFSASLNVIVHIAKEVSTWPGAIILVPKVSTWALLSMTLGGLWLFLWRTRWRFFGLPPMVMAVLSLFITKQPDIHIDREGKIVAATDEKGNVWLSSQRSGKFAAELWQKQNATLTGGALEDIAKCDDDTCFWRQKGYDILLIKGERILKCPAADIVLSRVPLRGKCQGRLLTLDRFDLWKRGGHSLWLEASDVRVLNAADEQGSRPWSRVPTPRKRRD